MSLTSNVMEYVVFAFGVNVSGTETWPVASGRTCAWPTTTSAPLGSKTRYVTPRGGSLPSRFARNWNSESGIKGFGLAAIATVGFATSYAEATRVKAAYEGFGRPLFEISPLCQRSPGVSRKTYQMNIRRSGTVAAACTALPR